MSESVVLTLAPEQETLLITLYAKAQPDNPLFFDPKALEILNRVDYDFNSLDVPYKTVILVCQRAKKIDSFTKDFLSEHPGGVVLQLGCGLDSRFLRVDNGQVIWYDLDMPPVVELRQKFFTESERYHMIASSATNLAWLEGITVVDRPLLIIAEGLLMYLDEADVRRLILRLHETFPGCRMVADVFSRLAARSAINHPSLKITGATLGWGIDDPHDLETWAPGIHLMEEWFFSDDPDLDRLGLIYRLIYKVSGVFTTVQRAHRILYYQL